MSADAMDQLAPYVAAILQQSSPLAIVDQTVEKTSWQDQGFVVLKEVTDYRFANGAVIRRTVEQDDFPSEQACAECWITYEVVATGDAVVAIDPARMVFQNACRESFWLAYHTA
jgi:hypothetical protein